MPDFRGLGRGLEKKALLLPLLCAHAYMYNQDEGRAEPSKPVRREENHRRQATWTCRIKPGEALLPKSRTQVDLDLCEQKVVRKSESQMTDIEALVCRQASGFSCFTFLGPVYLKSGCRRHLHRRCWGPSLTADG